jgi:hypothetical protein
VPEAAEEPAVPAPLTAEYRLTPDVAARAVDEFLAARWRFLFRSTAKPLAAFSLYTAFCGAGLWFFHHTGADDWAVTVLTGMTVFGGITVGLVLLLILLGGLGLATARGRSKPHLPDGYTAGEPPLVRWTFHDGGFRTELDGATRDVTWDRVRLFLVTPNFWLVGVKRGPDLLLPRDVIPAAVRELVRERLPERYAQAIASSDSGIG